MQVLAHEMAGTTRIRVNALNPGPTRTAMRRQAFPAEEADRLPEPGAVIAPYLYLLGPAGREVSGASIDCQERPAPPPAAT
jgi:NAD(P)-dependent dehydrogenase (short-subunit alcohol dehydrogenase family)